MEFSDKYIKMVLALPEEFFKDWELEDGDQVYLIKEIAIADYRCSAEHGLYTVFDGKLATEEHSCTENWVHVGWLAEVGGIRPIPSKEQLQDMILRTDKAKLGNWPEIYILFNLYVWVDKKEYITVKDKPIDCLLLEYLMDLKYKEKWNGEKWI